VTATEPPADGVRDSARRPYEGTPVQIRTDPPDAELVAERIERLTTDALVTRRGYLRILAVLSGGLAGGSLAVAAGVFERRTQDTRKHKLITAQASAVPVGGQVRFPYPTSRDPAVLLRLGEQRWVAYSAVCTHLSCEVLWRSNSRELYCPCHDGHFDPRTGDPTAGPPQRPLPQIRIAQVNDQIWAIGEGRVKAPGE
jgi:Rieske Fe-S protein